MRSLTNDAQARIQGFKTFFKYLLFSFKWLKPMLPKSTQYCFKAYYHMMIRVFRFICCIQFEI